MTAIVETDGLGKKYGRRWAIQDCTLAIPAGKVVLLLGPNGAGKTTLRGIAYSALEGCDQRLPCFVVNFDDEGPSEHRRTVEKTLQIGDFRAVSQTVRASRFALLRGLRISRTVSAEGVNVH